jgi:hypothetical protein
MHAQQLVIIQWMDSCIPKEEEEFLNIILFSMFNQIYLSLMIFRQ